MTERRVRGCGVVAVLLLIGCTDGSGSTVPTTISDPGASVTEVTQLGTTVVATSTTAADSTLPGEVTLPGEPDAVVALWPAADVVVATPDEAARGFVSEAFGVSPSLRSFSAGDPTSGEMVLSAEGAESADRGVLLLRQFGEQRGWFVTAVVNDLAEIVWPTAGSSVPAGPLAVTGRAYGFEASVTVTAFLAGSPSVVFDSVHTQAGSMEEPGPFEVVLDLSAASVGDVVAIVVRGGAGLETDPGEVAALAVVIG